LRSRGSCDAVERVRAGFTGLVAALGALLPSRPALSAPALQGIGEASFGYTDNIESSPSTPIPGTSPKVGGEFLLLRAGAVLASASPRVVQRLTYNYTYDLFLQETSASTASNQLEYHGFFDLSPRSSLVLGGNVVQSNQYSALTLSPPGAGAVNATPAGSGAFLSATVDELLSFDVARSLRAYEGLAATEQTPIFGTVAPSTFEPTARIGLERAFRADALGAEGRGEYSLVEGSIDPDGAPLGLQEQIIGSAVGVWRHDWGRDFTSRAEAGGLRVQRLNTGRGLWAPTGRASLAYVRPMGDAELDYGHTITLNPLLGETLLVDEVRLRGALPLTHDARFSISASSGYQRAQILDADLERAATVEVILVDAGVGWQATESLLLGLRYQYIGQVSDVRVPPLPYTFAKNSIMLGAAFRFPPDREMPGPYRAPRRVDRSDELRGAGTPEPDNAASPTGPPGAGT
jgi:hypothetical protein